VEPGFGKWWCGVHRWVMGVDCLIRDDVYMLDESFHDPLSSPLGTLRNPRYIASSGRDDRTEAAD
jgi:hypothetical protein